jgi:hypothetical protein
MKTLILAVVAVTVTVFTFAATPIENAQFSQSLFAPVAQSFIDANNQRTAMEFAIAMQLKEQQARQQLADSEHQFQMELERQHEKSERERVEREYRQQSAKPVALAADVPIPANALDQVISAPDQQQAGLLKLTPDERAKLTEILVKLVRGSYALGLSTAAQPGSAINHTPAVRVAPPAMYVTPSSGHWVTGTIDQGKMVKLEDGSLWEIGPLNRIDSSLWLPADHVIVIEENHGPIDYKFQLVNTSRNQAAYAKLIAHD